MLYILTAVVSGCCCFLAAAILASQKVRVLEKKLAAVQAHYRAHLGDLETFAKEGAACLDAELKEWEEGE